MMKKFGVLFVLAFCGMASQQDVLNTIANQISKDSGSECSAPIIGSSRTGSNCTFVIEIDNDNNVVYLFVHQNNIYCLFNIV